MKTKPSNVVSITRRPKKEKKEQDSLDRLVNLLYSEDLVYDWLTRADARECVSNQFFATIKEVSVAQKPVDVCIFCIATETKINPGFFNQFLNHFPWVKEEKTLDQIKEELMHHIFEEAKKQLPRSAWGFIAENLGVVVKNSS
jgi:hypothetical protein